MPMGHGAWDLTTDQVTADSSSADAVVGDGAVVTGEIGAGLPFPWVGVMWMPGGQPLQVVDFSGREVIPPAREAMDGSTR